MGSGNKTPGATNVYGRWEHITSSYGYLWEVETQHQQLLMSLGDGNTTPAATDAYGKWKHNTSSY
jgi:hypothetical protein